MTDTDSRMMRRQQNKDAAETIAPDETHAAKDMPDTDGESYRAREAAKAGTATYALEQQDAIFAENKVFEEPNAVEAERPAPPAQGESLVQRGRSQLKR